MKKAFLGELAPELFKHYFLLALMGMALVVIFHLLFRDKDSDRTPRKFKISFWVRDNYKRVIASFIAIYVAIRFVHPFLGVELSDWRAFGFGIGADGIVALIREAVKKKDVVIPIKD